MLSFCRARIARLHALFMQSRRHQYSVTDYSGGAPLTSIGSVFFQRDTAARCLDCLGYGDLSRARRPTATSRGIPCFVEKAPGPARCARDALALSAMRLTPTGPPCGRSTTLRVLVCLAAALPVLPCTGVRRRTAHPWLRSGQPLPFHCASSFVHGPARTSMSGRSPQCCSPMYRRSPNPAHRRNSFGARPTVSGTSEKCNPCPSRPYGTRNRN